MTIDNAHIPTTFDDLIAEAMAAPTPGWDFSWLNGRATEERPSWGYQRLMSERLAGASAALDLQTGCGEVLAGAKKFPPTMAATEWYPPNVALATKLLHPRGVVLVATTDEPVLPFADGAFDLVTSRHPHDVGGWWPEIARVLTPGGTYFAQHNGPDTMLELIEFFLGPQPGAGAERQPEAERQEVEAAGLQMIDQRVEHLRVEFFDIGAVIYWLRKVIWAVPDFTVDRYRDRLLDLHQSIQDDGPFVTRAIRMLVEARKPG
ncbi:methyltransferase type 11 [Mycobacterium asiaticum]|uniref:Methyltransferase type 11 n=1 Tax=Mycobacterium asiaticum TaxID=1790 RepID=A0A1A3NH28_MYCAS|nr:methyltransferase type 11 [Mycobacterium asiaticum]